MSQAQNPPQRLISLDALRGFTVAGMIVVNSPGSWEFVYPPLRHANWHGLTPTDLVFPFFVFIMGVSVVLGLSRARETTAPRNLVGKILRRSLIIFALGLLLALIDMLAKGQFGFEFFRIPGVLQRLALGLALAVWLVDIRGFQRWTWVGIVFGANAITAYVLHGLLKWPFLLLKVGEGESALSVRDWAFEGLRALGLSGEAASLAWAVAYTALCFVPVWWLYRKRMFITA